MMWKVLAPRNGEARRQRDFFSRRGLPGEAEVCRRRVACCFWPTRYLFGLVLACASGSGWLLPCVFAFGMLGPAVLLPAATLRERHVIASWVRGLGGISPRVISFPKVLLVVEG